MKYRTFVIKSWYFCLLGYTYAIGIPSHGSCLRWRPLLVMLLRIFLQDRFRVRGRAASLTPILRPSEHIGVCSVSEPCSRPYNAIDRL